ncbi:hypothetical protein GCM10029964_012900 [Kibdelosporangium lantanae]
MTVRYRAGVIPAPSEIGDPERALAEQLTASEEASVAAMAGYDHREALARIWDLVRRTNAYVDERAPGTWPRTSPKRPHWTQPCTI